MEDDNLTVQIPTKQERNKGKIAISGLYTALMVVAGYFSKSSFLASDLFHKTKSSNKIKLPNQAAVIRARDTALVGHEDKKFFDKMGSEIKGVMNIGSEIRKEKISWIDSFKQQSGFSKFASVMIMIAGVVNAYVFIKELVSPSVTVIDEEAFAQMKAEKQRISQTNQISQEEAQALADKQAAAKQTSKTEALEASRAENLGQAAAER